MGKLTVNAPFDGEVLGELETTNETGIELSLIHI